MQILSDSRKLTLARFALSPPRLRHFVMHGLLPSMAVLGMWLPRRVNTG